MRHKLFRLLITFLMPTVLFCTDEVATEYIKPLASFHYDYTGIEEIDCIYCINLDIRVDKWKKMTGKFTKQELVVNRVPAINGWKELSKKTLSKLKAPNKSKLTPGQIGCILSHLSILKDAKRRGYNNILVLEDDIDFIHDMSMLGNYIKLVTWHDPDWDVLFIDDWKGEDYNILRPIDRPNSTMSQEIQKPKIPFYYYEEYPFTRVFYRHGMYALIVSKKGIKKILTHFAKNPISLAIDIELNHIDSIRMYETVKSFVKVNLSISDTAKKPL